MNEDVGAGRALLIGEASTTGEPFVGRSGDRLRSLLGAKDLTLIVDVMNLLPSPTGKVGKGRAFPAKKGREMAAAVLAAELNRTKFILAGKRVAAAFGIRAAYFEVVVKDGRQFMIIPHPSGINRWWNEHGAAERFIAEFYGFINGGAS